MEIIDRCGGSSRQTTYFLSLHEHIEFDGFSRFGGKNNPRNGFIVKNGSKNTSVDVVDIPTVISYHLCFSLKVIQEGLDLPEKLPLVVSLQELVQKYYLVLKVTPEKDSLRKMVLRTLM